MDNEYTYLESLQPDIPLSDSTDHVSEKERVMDKLVKQSKLNSALETTLNIVSGFLLAWCITFWILPLWGYSYVFVETLEITALYTVVSWLRSYTWRRVFERSR